MEFGSVSTGGCVEKKDAQKHDSVDETVKGKLLIKVFISVKGKV